MSTYPKCVNTFTKILFSEPELFTKLMDKKLTNIRLFDVTLRDGLQGLSRSEQEILTVQDKMKIYKNIINNYSPKKIEVGSLVNNKILPVFKDTEKLFKNIKENSSSNGKNIDYYVLVSNLLYLKQAINMGVQNFSFITSLSNSFQLKNTKMTLEENLNHLKTMMNILDNEMKTNDGIEKNKVKLYVSCINECPIEGKIPTTRIVDKLLELHHLNVDKICLSDTCGTLTKEDFMDIINNITKKGLETKKISLHLHVNPEREDEIEEIVHSAFNHGIYEFDVSYNGSGGCSVTMDKNKLAPNMNYEQFYKFLMNYLLKNDK
jgi:hydroxymethylglutaryl-CoA lyase